VTGAVVVAEDLSALDGTEREIARSSLAADGLPA
jgi:hypothetical protein